VVEPLLLWRRLIGAQIRAQLQYRLSFALDFAGTFLIAFIDFLAVLVIFHNVHRLGVWSVREVALLYALSSIAFAFTDLVIGHLDQFPQKVRDGNFDILLIRPRGTLFQVIASDFQLRRLGRAFQGMLVLVYALASLDLHWTVGRALLLVVTVPSAVVIFGSVWSVGACVAFWTTDGGEFVNAFTYGGNLMSQYPIDIYSAWLRRFLAYIVPLAFVCYFPALYLLDKPDPLGLPRVLQFASPVVAVVAAFVASAIWQFAVRHYRSAGG
jgi:ABC-2 type transport system permease protein